MTRGNGRARASLVAALAAARLAALPAEAATFSPVALHPDAAQQPASGRTLLTLKPWNGRIYSGFGDYQNNTGPVAIRAFDPATRAFGPLRLRQATEAVHLFREYDGRLFAPHTDPIAGESSGGFAEALPGVPDDAWRDRLLVTGVHFYDVATFTGSDLFLVGSRGNDAAVWRSVDGGATFPDPPVLAQTPASGFSRYYFAAPFAGRLYVQATGFRAAKVWDGAAWGDGPDLLPTGGHGWHPETFASELVYQTQHAGVGASPLLRFDGLEARRLLSPAVYDFAVANGTLWALTARFVPVPGSSGGGFYEPDAVLHTSDLCSWQGAAAPAPAEARSLAVAGTELFLGGRDAQIYAWSEPVAAALPAAPLELRRLRAVKRGADVALVAESLLAPGGCETYTLLAAPETDAASLAQFSTAASGLASPAWTHAGAAADGRSHAYLMFAVSPHGAGPTGR